MVLNTEKIPKLREKWGQMYEWIFELMRYIDGMAGWDIKALRTSRIKVVIQEAAGIRYQEGAEKLIMNKKGSGEEYAKRVLEFLTEVRDEKRRKVKEEVEKTNWNVSARVFCPEEKKEEAKKNEIREESETIELYPKGGLVTIHSDKFSDKGLENNVGKSVMHSDKANLKERGFTEVMSSTLPLQLRMEKGEIEKNAGRREGETIELYPKEGLMSIYSEKFSDKELEKSVMHSDKFSDKELGNDVKKLRNPATERKEEEEKIDFFPQWKPPQGGVVEENEEEEEQYMTIGEDGRPYIAVRIRQRQENVDNQGLQMPSHIEEERNEVREEEKVTKIEEEEDKEMEDLIREYQESARPNTKVHS